MNVPALVSKLELRGEPKTYRKTGDSGDQVATTFCSDCGAALYSSKGEAPAFVYLRVGSVNQRAELAPRAQGFCASAMPWAMDIRAVPQIGSKPGGAAR